MAADCYVFAAYGVNFALIINVIIIIIVVVVDVISIQLSRRTTISHHII